MEIRVDWQTQNTKENHKMGEFFPFTKKRLSENQEYKKRNILTNSRKPQGSVVAPILFLIYVSNIPDTPAEILSSQMTLHYFTGISPVS